MKFELPQLEELVTRARRENQLLAQASGRDQKTGWLELKLIEDKLFFLGEELGNEVDKVIDERERERERQYEKQGISQGETQPEKQRTASDSTISSEGWQSRDEVGQVLGEISLHGLRMRQTVCWLNGRAKDWR